HSRRVRLLLYRPEPLRRPRSTLLPYTTLFRSRRPQQQAERERDDDARTRLQRDSQLIECPAHGESRDETERNAMGWALYELRVRSEEHTSELQSHLNLVCRLLLE